MFRSCSNCHASQVISGRIKGVRYKSFPVQDESYYLTVMRYIESNPVRAEIVTNTKDSPWSSLAVRQGCESLFDLRVPIKMNRRTENERFCVWQGRRSRPSEDGRWSLTPSRRRISRLNAESFCVGALNLVPALKSSEKVLLKASFFAVFVAKTIFPCGSLPIWTCDGEP